MRNYRVTLDHPTNGPAATYDILTNEGVRGAVRAAMALVTLGGTRPTALRVAAVVDAGEPSDAILGA